MPGQDAGGSVPNRADFDALLVREYGSYLHNVVPEQAGLCLVCSTPVSGGYSKCWPCSQAGPSPGRIGGSPELADRLAFMTYAVEGGQAYSVLRGYKTPSVQDRYWTAAATWVVWFLTRHGDCAQSLAGTTQSHWAWATVPSARSGRTGEHPLHFIVRQLWGTTHAEVGLSLAAGAGRVRGYDPAKFVAEAVDPGTHVVLVDDSWTTGANVQSAATALKTAGAGQVSAMVLARLLKDTWDPTREFLASGGLRSQFDPDACPWPGMTCHGA